MTSVYFLTFHFLNDSFIVLFLVHISVLSIWRAGHFLLVCLSLDSASLEGSDFKLDIQWDPGLCPRGDVCRTRVLTEFRWPEKQT